MRAHTQSSILLVYASARKTLSVFVGFSPTDSRGKNVRQRARARALNFLWLRARSFDKLLKLIDGQREKTRQYARGERVRLLCKAD